MDFCSKVAVKLLLKGVNRKKNILTSPLSYNAIMNMIAAGSSGGTLQQILSFLQHKNIEDVNSESSAFAKITCEQPRKSPKQKISFVEIEDGEADVDEVNELKLDNGLFAFKYGDPGEAPITSFLNGVWVNKHYVLKDSFKDLLQNIYKAKAENIDCEKPGLVVQEINEWASASTKGLIKDVLNEDHITRDTALVLGNALHFKGSWEEPFVKTSTHRMPFYLLNGENIEVPFMTGCKIYSHNFFKGFQVARIPYSDGGDANRKFAMYIFLLNEKHGLKRLLKKIDSNPKFFGQCCDIKKLFNTTVDISWIPKFKFSYLTEESPKVMKGMGLTLPFDMEKAELSEMIKEGDLPKHQNVCVSKIIQKAFIEVNEKGTEAAAATIATMEFGRSAYRNPPTKFIADHPCMFIIREENSGIIFFTGAVLNPLEA